MGSQQILRSPGIPAHLSFLALVVSSCRVRSVEMAVKLLLMRKMSLLCGPRMEEKVSVMLLISSRRICWNECSMLASWLTRNGRQLLALSCNGERIQLLVGMKMGAATKENNVAVPPKIELPYDPLIPLVGIYTKETKSLSQRDTCTAMFQKHHLQQPRQGSNLSVHWQMNGWRQYGTQAWDEELFSHEKEGNPTICDNIDESGGRYAKWSESDREKTTTYWYLLYVESLKKKRKVKLIETRDQKSGCQGLVGGGNK